jgi:hypothetical protein
MLLLGENRAYDLTAFMCNPISFPYFFKTSRKFILKNKQKIKTLKFSLNTYWKSIRLFVRGMKQKLRTSRNKISMQILVTGTRCTIVWAIRDGNAPYWHTHHFLNNFILPTTHTIILFKITDHQWNWNFAQNDHQQNLNFHLHGDPLKKISVAIRGGHTFFCNSPNILFLWNRKILF